MQKNFERGAVLLNPAADQPQAESNSDGTMVSVPVDVLRAFVSAQTTSVPELTPQRKSLWPRFCVGVIALAGVVALANNTTEGQKIIAQSVAVLQETYHDLFGDESASTGPSTSSRRVPVFIGRTDGQDTATRQSASLRGDMVDIPQQCTTTAALGELCVDSVTIGETGMIYVSVERPQDTDPLALANAVSALSPEACLEELSGLLQINGTNQDSAILFDPEGNYLTCAGN